MFFGAWHSVCSWPHKVTLRRKASKNILHENTSPFLGLRKAHGLSTICCQIVPAAESGTTLPVTPCPQLLSVALLFFKLLVILFLLPLRRLLSFEPHPSPASPLQTIVLSYCFTGPYPACPPLPPPILPLLLRNPFKHATASTNYFCMVL